MFRVNEMKEHFTQLKPVQKTPRRAAYGADA